MKTNDLNPKERRLYYNDSDIFNTRPPKTPERFKIKNIISSKLLTKNSYNNISTELPIHKNNQGNQSYNYYNQTDHVNDCMRSMTPIPSFMSKYKKYKTIGDLKKMSKKLQLDQSYEYNYNDNNNIYKNNINNAKKRNIILGNEPINYYSEYNHMQDYATKIMLKKTINNAKLLNKSVDMPQKFIPLSKKYNKRNTTKDMFIKNSINYDLNKSNDNINLNSNNINHYKSNIFFDKEKDEINEELDKIENDKIIQRKKEQLRNKEREKEKEKYYDTFVRKRKTNFLYEDLNIKKNGNLEENRKFNRDGNYPLQYANYKTQKEFKIKSLDDEYNAKNRRLYNGLSEMERNTDKYIVLGISKNDKFDSREIKKIFLKNGIHMFGEQTFSSYIENGKKGKFVFNIRKDLKDKDYNEKFKKVQNYLMKKQGIVFDIDNRRINYNKKKTDIAPTFTLNKEKKTFKHK